MSQPPLLVNVAELQRDPGKQRHLSLSLDAADVEAAHPAVGGEVGVELDLVSSIDDVVVTGWLAVRWQGSCRRCLRPLGETLQVEVEERYSDDPGLVERGEAVAIVRGQLDLAPVVRDEVLLTAGEERLCLPDCAGLCSTCGVDRNAGPCGCDAPVVDDRWQVLDTLRQPEP